jgi:FAD/FMN-containing dehydrogenase
MATKTVDALRTALTGPVWTPDDSGYDDVRLVHNGLIDRYPAAVAQCRSAGDVQAVIRTAQESGRELAVRGGAHSVAGFGTGDDVIVCDLSGMEQVVVDADSWRARVGGGANWHQFNDATGQVGLATTGGVISTTGVGGLTLGGGIGYLARQYGLSCDNLVSAQVVLADGRVVTASEREHPDLFWALRGGGGNFGVVTEFTFTLHPVDQVLGGLMLFELDDAENVLRYFDDFIADAPREYGGYPALHVAPPLPFVPADRVGDTFVAVVSCWNGPVDSGARVLDGIRDVAAPAAEHIEPMPYPQINSLFDEMLPRGIRAYWKTVNLDRLTDGALHAHLEHGPRLPAMTSTIHLYTVNGAVHDVPSDATAFPDRDAVYSANIAGMWPDEADDETSVAWVKDYHAALVPHARSGGYVNFSSADDQSRAAASYGNNLVRLQQVKRHYDPDNLFHLNQNVAPAPTDPGDG